MSTPPPRPPRVAIIVLNWNGAEDTLECLTSLAAVSYANHWVVVADNGSEDDSVARIRARFPSIEILENRANLGYAGGNNRAITHVMAGAPDFVLLLNNDVEVAPDFLDHMIAAAESLPNAGFLGPMTFSHGEYSAWIEALGGCYWDPERLDFRSLAHRERGDQHAGAPPVLLDYATGSCLLVRADVISRVGLMDEHYFLTFEESDWCYRGRELGYLSYAVPSAHIWHKVSVSFGGIKSPLVDYFMTRNRLYFADRHLSRGARHRLLLRAAVSVLRACWPAFRMGHRTGNVSRLRHAYWSVRRFLDEVCAFHRNPRVLARFHGLLDYLAGRSGDCPAPLRSQLRMPRPSG